MASHDDQYDLQVLERVARRLDRAQYSRSMGLHAAADRELQGYLIQELMENRAEIEQARRELAHSSREVRHSTQEVVMDSAAGMRPGAQLDDRADLHDDLRDRADDRRDLDLLERQYSRRQAISTELNHLYGRIDPYSVARKRALVQELTMIALESSRNHRSEKYEDMSEMREDRLEVMELDRR